MDAREFEQIVDAFYRDLYRFALSLTRNPDDASDLTQQTFATFAQKQDDLRDRARCKSWLFTTLYRDFLRQGARAQKIVSMEPETLEIHAPPVAASGAASAEHREILDTLLGLEEPYRAVLSLFYLEDYSYKDIAAILDIPLGTVMSRIARAKEALRAAMKSSAG